MQTIQSFIEEQLRESSRVKAEMEKTLSGSIREAHEVIVRALSHGGKILLCGNGGSAADCQHIAAELVGRFRLNRPALPAVALTTDTSILTAVANDWAFEQIFSRQVEALGEKGDVLMAFSTSGKSPNVVHAMMKAAEKGMCSIALTGNMPGPVSKLAQVWIRIPCDDVPRVQEGHITVGHILCDLVERRFFEKKASGKPR